MPQSVNGFFENGGKRLYVCRIVGKTATTARKVLGDFTLGASGPGVWGRRIWFRIQDPSTTGADGATGFRLKVAFWTSLGPSFQPYDPFDPQNKLRSPRPEVLEDHGDLSVNPSSSNFFEKILIDSTTRLPVSALAFIERTNMGTTSRPPNTDVNGEFLDQDGTDDPDPLDGEDYAGREAGERSDLQGLVALELNAFRDVSLVYAPHPPQNAVAIIRKVIDHCQRLRFRFAVIDSPDSKPADLDPRTSILDTAWAAFYTPWLVIPDLQTGARTAVPPGGHVLGVYVRTDTDRGVFKAPANETLRGVVDLRFEINDSLQEVLNLRGVNVIRRFQGRGIRVWGARTLSSGSEWKYVNARRFLIFLEQSIYEGTQWVVFEPNDDKLWARVTDTIRVFLFSQWGAGALFGSTEREAFFIRCDRTTMTPDDILNGRLICEIGVALVRPAEFVIFRLFQYTLEAQS
jgi:phage tail sheath protein FI